MSFTVDVSEILAFAQRGEAAARMVPATLQKAGRASGEAVVRTARARARVKTGTMKNSINVESVKASGSGVVVRIVASAQSAKGFPYPRSIEYGRAGFSATRAKVLVFPVNGKMVYTKRVGPARAQPFMGPGLTDAAPFILAAFKREYAALLASWGG